MYYLVVLSWMNDFKKKHLIMDFKKRNLAVLYNRSFARELLAVI